MATSSPYTKKRPVRMVLPNLVKPQSKPNTFQEDSPISSPTRNFIVGRPFSISTDDPIYRSSSNEIPRCQFPFIKEEDIETDCEDNQGSSVMESFSQNLSMNDKIVLNIKRTELENLPKDAELYLKQRDYSEAVKSAESNSLDETSEYQSLKSYKDIGMKITFVNSKFHDNHLFQTDHLADTPLDLTPVCSFGVKPNTYRTVQLTSVKHEGIEADCEDNRNSSPSYSSDQNLPQTSNEKDVLHRRRAESKNCVENKFLNSCKISEAVEGTESIVSVKTNSSGILIPNAVDLYFKCQNEETPISDSTKYLIGRSCNISPNVCRTSLKDYPPGQVSLMKHKDVETEYEDNQYSLVTDLCHESLSENPNAVILRTKQTVTEIVQNADINVHTCSSSKVVGSIKPASAEVTKSLNLPSNEGIGIKITCVKSVAMFEDKVNSNFDEEVIREEVISKVPEEVNSKIQEEVTYQSQTANVLTVKPFNTFMSNRLLVFSSPNFHPVQLPEVKQVEKQCGCNQNVSRNTLYHRNISKISHDEAEHNAGQAHSDDFYFNMLHSSKAVRDPDKITSVLKPSALGSILKVQREGSPCTTVNFQTNEQLSTLMPHRPFKDYSDDLHLVKIPAIELENIKINCKDNKNTKLSNQNASGTSKELNILDTSRMELKNLQMEVKKAYLNECDKSVTVTNVPESQTSAADTKEKLTPKPTNPKTNAMRLISKVQDKSILSPATNFSRDRPCNTLLPVSLPQASAKEFRPRQFYINRRKIEAECEDNKDISPKHICNQSLSETSVVKVNLQTKSKFENFDTTDCLEVCNNSEEVQNEGGNMSIVTPESQNFKRCTVGFEEEERDSTLHFSKDEMNKELAKADYDQCGGVGYKKAELRESPPLPFEFSEQTNPATSSPINMKTEPFNVDSNDSSSSSLFYEIVTKNSYDDGYQYDEHKNFSEESNLHSSLSGSASTVQKEDTHSLQQDILLEISLNDLSPDRRLDVSPDTFHAIHSSLIMQEEMDMEFGCNEGTSRIDLCHKNTSEITRDGDSLQQTKLKKFQNLHNFDLSTCEDSNDISSTLVMNSVAKTRYETSKHSRISFGKRKLETNSSFSSTEMNETPIQVGGQKYKGMEHIINKFPEPHSIQTLEQTIQQRDAEGVEETVKSRNRSTYSTNCLSEDNANFDPTIYESKSHSHSNSSVDVENDYFCRNSAKYLRLNIFYDHQDIEECLYYLQSTYLSNDECKLFYKEQNDTSLTQNSSSTINCAKCEPDELNISDDDDVVIISENGQNLPTNNSDYRTMSRLDLIPSTSLGTCPVESFLDVRAETSPSGELCNVSGSALLKSPSPNADLSQQTNHESLVDKTPELSVPVQHSENNYDVNTYFENKKLKLSNKLSTRENNIDYSNNNLPNIQMNISRRLACKFDLSPSPTACNNESMKSKTIRENAPNSNFQGDIPVTPSSDLRKEVIPSTEDLQKVLELAMLLPKTSLNTNLFSQTKSLVVSPKIHDIVQPAEPKCNQNSTLLIKQEQSDNFNIDLNTNSDSLKSNLQSSKISLDSSPEIQDEVQHFETIDNKNNTLLSKQEQADNLEISENSSESNFPSSQVMFPKNVLKESSKCKTSAFEDIPNRESVKRKKTEVNVDKDSPKKMKNSDDLYRQPVENDEQKIESAKCTANGHKVSSETSDTDDFLLKASTFCQTLRANDQ